MLSTLPRTAVPSGPPSLLIACSAADPTPLRSADSSQSAADIEVASARPIPNPTTAVHAATNRPLEPTLVRAPISNPAARIANPTATATFAPTSRTIRSAGTAPTTQPADQRQQPQARPHRACSEHSLEVLGHREQHPEHREDRDRGKDHPPRVGRQSETAPDRAAADHPACG